MLKKTFFTLFLVLASYSKLFAQSPSINVADLPCSITVCISAINTCKQVSCASPACITIPAHSPGIYFTATNVSCLSRHSCTAWDISFESGPCETIQEDPPSDNLVTSGVATGWASTCTGQGYIWKWDGTTFYIQD